MNLFEKLDHALFPRDKTCRPYWCAARAYFISMTIFLIGMMILQLLSLRRMQGLGVPTVILFTAILLFQLVVTYVHSISVACLHHGGGSCKSLSHFWLTIAIIYQFMNSVLSYQRVRNAESLLTVSKAKSK